MVKEQNLSIEGDLNFTISQSSCLGSTCYNKSTKCIFLVPLGKSTWINKRVGEVVVEKRLDRFILISTLLHRIERSRTSRVVRGGLDHFSLIL